ncbi:MAG: hypothetical protein ACOYJB_09970 [Christensenellaceae bacterium]|jgi:hypothetical protein
MKRKFAAVLAVLCVCIVGLSACAPDVTINTPQGNFGVVEATIEEEYDGQAAPSGSRFLVVTLKPGTDNLNDIQAAFYSVGDAGFEEQTEVSVGGETVPLNNVSYLADEGVGTTNIFVRLFFIVPDSWDGQKNVTFSGEGISSVVLPIG